jgi:hypothetical protein
VHFEVRLGDVFRWDFIRWLSRSINCWGGLLFCSRTVNATQAVDGTFPAKNVAQDLNGNVRLLALRRRSVYAET